MSHTIAQSRRAVPSWGAAAAVAAAVAAAGAAAAAAQVEVAVAVAVLAVLEFMEVAEVGDPKGGRGAACALDFRLRDLDQSRSPPGWWFFVGLF